MGDIHRRNLLLFSMALILAALWMLIRHAGNNLDGANNDVGSVTHINTRPETEAPLEKSPEALDVEDRSEFVDWQSHLSQPEKLEHRDRHRMNTDVPLVTRYEDLVKKALSGDSIAATDLAASLSYCAAVPRTDEQQDQLINYTYQTRRVEGYIYPVDELDGAIRKIVRKYEFCKGITREQILDNYLYQKIAAENGSLQAKADALDYGGMHYDDVWPARKRAWSSEEEEIEHIVRHTADAAEAGNANAISRLGNIFETHDPTFDELDIDINLSVVEAAAYRIAGAHLRQLSGHSEAERAMEKTINSLSLQDATTAITLANEIIRRDGCCFVYRWTPQTEY